MSENVKNENENVNAATEESTPAEVSAPVEESAPVETSAPVEDEWVLTTTKAAEAGDGYAQLELGRYYSGQEEYEKALEWLLKAGENETFDACWQIADMYRDGLGTEESLEKAAEWYLRGAEWGECYSRVEIADMYFFGDGVPRSYQKAFKWFKLCSQQDGGQYGRWALADMYREGLGVKQSNKMAVEWYNCAFDTAYDMFDVYVDYHAWGDADAYLEKVKKCYEECDSKLAFIGLRGIGNLYRDGCGVKKSLEKAIQLYKLAAEKGDVYSMRELGYRYCCGEGVEQSYEKGYAWYLKAAEQGDLFSVWAIGNLYRYGNFVEQSDTKAVQWYTMAAEANDHFAQVSLSEMYADGRGVAQSDEESRLWLKKSHREAELFGMRRELVEEKAYHEEEAISSILGSYEHNVLEKTRARAEREAAALRREEKQRRQVREELIAEYEQRIADLEQECTAVQLPSLVGLEAMTDRYGAGTIVAQDLDEITVRFGDSERTFVLNEKYPEHPCFENDEAFLKLCTEYRPRKEELEKLKAEVQRLREANAAAGA